MNPSVASAEIDLGALVSNAQVVRQYAPEAKISAVVKANAYGHGLESVVEALSPHVDGFAVAHCGEALQVRKVETGKPVWIFLGFQSDAELERCIRHRLTPVLTTSLHLSRLKTLCRESLSVVAELDIGMGRMGLTSPQLREFVEWLSGQDLVHLSAILGHFPASEDESPAGTRQQQEKFLRSIDGIEVDRSLANSAAVLSHPNSHLDWVRPGLMLYGISPIPGHVGSDFGLQPVMRVSAKLGGVRWMDEGDSIGYGSTYVCSKPMRVGLVLFGYADGYPRQSRSFGQVALHGKRARILGRVAMDSLIIDLTEAPDAREGDDVELWGANLPVEEVASLNNAIPHQVLVGLGSRVKRIFKK